MPEYVVTPTIWNIAVFLLVCLGAAVGVVLLIRRGAEPRKPERPSRRWILVGLLLLPAAAQAAPPDDIRAYCARVHRSYQYRAICERSEKAAKDRLARAVGFPSGVPQEIWAYCADIHSSWRYAEICSVRELRAMHQLLGAPPPESTNCGRFFCP